MSRVLVVEDDAGIRRVINRGLVLAGHDVAVADSVASARASWHAGTYDLVLLDVMLPDGDGIALLNELRDAGELTPVVLLTARDEAELRERATAAGATDYLRKPFAYPELLACVARFTRDGAIG